MKRLVIVPPVIAAFFFFAQVISSKPRDRGQPLEFEPSPPPPAFVTNLAEFDFEDGQGGPDPQGWYSVDASVADQYSQVDDFAGLPNPPWQATEGAQSFWIGTRGDGPEFCHWVAPPGYGNYWLEHLESTTFNTTGDVTLSYKIAYDNEEGYDPIVVQYLSKTGSWNDLALYWGLAGFAKQTHEIGVHVVDADSIDGSVRFRFRFTSDGCCSDEDGLYAVTDGAAVIDSISVDDSNGSVDYEDFEDETTGDKETTDGDWFGGPREYFGDFAGLFDGSTVLQEDTIAINNSHLWGFFNGSPDTYACGGFPGQASVPLLPVGGSGAYIRNAITSPAIDLSKDKDGNPVPSPPDDVALAFDVYQDLVPGNEVYYAVRYQPWWDGCMSGPWGLFWLPNDGPNKAWHREEVVIRVRTGVTHMKFQLLAVDVGDNGAHSCNSHAPLFDNVTIDGWFDTVTGIRPEVDAGYALHANHPNPFNPKTTIPFDVPSGGGMVRLDVYEVSGRLVTTLIDGYRGEGRYDATWDGRDSAGRDVGTGVYFYRLVAPGFTESRKMVLLK